MKIKKQLLNSHSGYDIGSLAIARQLSRKLSAPLFTGTVTRLLIDLNRSLNHRQVFSTFTRSLPSEDREELIARYYQPYRQAVCDAIDNAPPVQQVLHLSVHSFSPFWQGRKRHADIGLLYDPKRRREADFCGALAAQLKLAAPHLRIRRNYPYRGANDGFTTSLRRRYSMRRYLGIELEFNQALCAHSGRAISRLTSIIAGCVDDVNNSPR